MSKPLSLACPSSPNNLRIILSYAPRIAYAAPQVNELHSLREHALVLTQRVNHASRDSQAKNEYGTHLPTLTHCSVLRL